VTLIISSRFCGPPRSGNGGYVCGRLAAHVDGPASVRLKAPPPLDTALVIDRFDSIVRLLNGSIVVAEARTEAMTLTAPPGPAFAEAERASTGCSGFTRHAFPTCFVCGPDRAIGDGLRIFPGPVGSRSMVAAPWIPDTSLDDGSGHVAPEFLWAALDCTSAFPFLPMPDGQAIVLGELSVRIDGHVAPGEGCVVTGWAVGIEGRKHFSASALYSETGRPVAVGRATWIEVASSAFGGT
jgi:hypothetical protein